MEASDDIRSERISALMRKNQANTTKKDQNKNQIAQSSRLSTSVPLTATLPSYLSPQTHPVNHIVFNSEHSKMSPKESENLQKASATYFYKHDPAMLHTSSSSNDGDTLKQTRGNIFYNKSSPTFSSTSSRTNIAPSSLRLESDFRSLISLSAKKESATNINDLNSDSNSMPTTLHSTTIPLSTPTFTSTATSAFSPVVSAITTLPSLLLRSSLDPRVGSGEFTSHSHYPIEGGSWTSVLPKSASRGFKSSDSPEGNTPSPSSFITKTAVGHGAKFTRSTSVSSALPWYFSHTPSPAPEAISSKTEIKVHSSLPSSSLFVSPYSSPVLLSTESGVEQSAVTDNENTIPKDHTISLNVDDEVEKEKKNKGQQEKRKKRKTRQKQKRQKGRAPVLPGFHGLSFPALRVSDSLRVLKSSLGLPRQKTTEQNTSFSRSRPAPISPAQIQATPMAILQRVWHLVAETIAPRSLALAIDDILQEPLPPISSSSSSSFSSSSRNHARLSSSESTLSPLSPNTDLSQFDDDGTSDSDSSDSDQERSSSAPSLKSTESKSTHRRKYPPRVFVKDTNSMKETTLHPLLCPCDVTLPIDIYGSRERVKIRLLLSILEPCDVLLVRTPGKMYNFFRTSSHQMFDHVGIVLSPSHFLHIGPPAVRLLPLKAIMTSDRLPIVLRPRLDAKERKEMIDVCASIIGYQYATVFAYKQVYTLSERRWAHAKAKLQGTAYLHPKLQSAKQVMNKRDISTTNASLKSVSASSMLSTPLSAVPSRNGKCQCEHDAIYHTFIPNFAQISPHLISRLGTSKERYICTDSILQRFLYVSSTCRREISQRLQFLDYGSLLCFSTNDVVRIAASKALLTAARNKIHQEIDENNNDNKVDGKYLAFSSLAPLFSSPHAIDGLVDMPIEEMDEMDEIVPCNVCGAKNKNSNCNSEDNDMDEENHRPFFSLVYSPSTGFIHPTILARLQGQEYRERRKTARKLQNQERKQYDTMLAQNTVPLSLLPPSPSKTFSPFALPVRRTIHDVLLEEALKPSEFPLPTSTLVCKSSTSENASSTSENASSTSLTKDTSTLENVPIPVLSGSARMVLTALQTARNSLLSQADSFGIRLSIDEKKNSTNDTVVKRNRKERKEEKDVLMYHSNDSLSSSSSSSSLSSSSLPSTLFNTTVSFLTPEQVNASGPPASALSYKNNPFITSIDHGRVNSLCSSPTSLTAPTDSSSFVTYVGRDPSSLAKSNTSLSRLRSIVSPENSLFARSLSAFLVDIVQHGPPSIPSISLTLVPGSPADSMTQSFQTLRTRAGSTVKRHVQKQVQERIFAHLPPILQSTFSSSLDKNPPPRLTLPNILTAAANGGSEELTGLVLRHVAYSTRATAKNLATHAFWKTWEYARPMVRLYIVTYIISFYFPAVMIVHRPLGRTLMSIYLMASLLKASLEDEKNRQKLRRYEQQQSGKKEKEKSDETNHNTNNEKEKVQTGTNLAYSIFDSTRVSLPASLSPPRSDQAPALSSFSVSPKIFSKL